MRMEPGVATAGWTGRRALTQYARKKARSMPLVKQIVAYLSACHGCDTEIAAGDYGVVDTKERVLYCEECAEEVADRGDEELHDA